MKSPSKKPAKAFMAVGGVYMNRNDEVDTIESHSPGEKYPWGGKNHRYTDLGMFWWNAQDSSEHDLIARVSIRVIRRNPWLGGGKK